MAFRQHRAATTMTMMMVQIWDRHKHNKQISNIQYKLTDLPLIIADRRHSLLRHVCCLPPDVPAHNILQHCANHRWKRITGAQSTCCGHRRRIARCGGRYGPRWSGAAVSEWVSINKKVSYSLPQTDRTSAFVVDQWPWKNFPRRVVWSPCKIWLPLLANEKVILWIRKAIHPPQTTDSAYYLCWSRQCF